MQQIIVNSSLWRWLSSQLDGRHSEKPSISSQSRDEAWNSHQASLGVELTALKEESETFLKNCEELGNQLSQPTQCSTNPSLSVECVQVRNDCE